MRQPVVKFIIELATPRTFPTAPGPRGVSPLNHEILDQPMKLDAPVVTLLTQQQKIVARLWHHVAFKLQVDGP